MYLLMTDYYLYDFLLTTHYLLNIFYCLLFYYKVLALLYNNIRNKKIHFASFSIESPLLKLFTVFISLQLFFNTNVFICCFKSITLVYFYLLYSFIFLYFLMLKIFINMHQVVKIAFLNHWQYFLNLEAFIFI